MVKQIQMKLSESKTMVGFGTRCIYNALRLLHHGYDGSASGFITNPRYERRPWMEWR